MRSKLINLKVSQEEYDKIKDNAVKYNGGNISKYLREIGAKDEKPKEKTSLDNENHNNLDVPF